MPDTPRFSDTDIGRLAQAQERAQAPTRREFDGLRADLADMRGVVVELAQVSVRQERTERDMLEIMRRQQSLNEQIVQQATEHDRRLEARITRYDTELHEDHIEPIRETIALLLKLKERAWMLAAATLGAVAALGSVLVVAAGGNPETVAPALKKLIGLLLPG